MKKVILPLVLMLFVLVGCKEIPNEEITDDSLEIDEIENSIIENDEIENDEVENDKTSKIEAESTTNADKLIDLFIDGEIMAYYVEGEKSPFYFTDLPSDPYDFTYCSIGDRVDLDNDGENELIIDGAYGGIYLDAREGKVYVLTEGDGTAYVLSYTEFDGQKWIVHSDTTHGGRIFYNFTLYDGTGNVVDTFNLKKEFWDNPQEEDGPNTVYTYRDEEITKEEYDELRMKMLGY